MRVVWYDNHAWYAIFGVLMTLTAVNFVQRLDVVLRVQLIERICICSCSCCCSSTYFEHIDRADYLHPLCREKYPLQCLRASLDKDGKGEGAKNARHNEYPQPHDLRLRRQHDRV